MCSTTAGRLCQKILVPRRDVGGDIRGRDRLILEYQKHHGMPKDAPVHQTNPPFGWVPFFWAFLADSFILLRQDHCWTSQKLRKITQTAAQTDFSARAEKREILHAVGCKLHRRNQRKVIFFWRSGFFHQKIYVERWPGTGTTGFWCTRYTIVSNIHQEELGMAW